MTRKVSTALCFAKLWKQRTAHLPVIRTVMTGKNSRNIAEDFGLAQATIIITEMKNLFPPVHSNIFHQLSKQVILHNCQKMPGESIDAFLNRIKPIVYDLKFEPKLVDQSANIDNVKASSVNFYEGVTQKEVEAFLQQV